ncbi:GTPase domain-containing protein [Polyangium aurulentum]|uniref:GTPase domain-containing protein n=1 Tax=Polyangium aurulentum TaxID=2567896 RepID=UPI0010AE5C09|nr:GTPase domain-containing protein [Polyangium aurulentum]UQA61373.1 GTPase domain-containing protein [Polyangium aurulentum]
MTTIIVVLIVAAALVGVLVMVGMRASKLGQELEEADRKIASLQGDISDLSAKNTALQEEDKKKAGWLEAADQENTWLRSELDKRPKLNRKTYRILTLGMKATGKTSLTLKWSNPLVDLGTIEGTKIERYERSVSHVPSKDNTVTEHVFEVHDWGGEHIVDAQQELIVEEIHGLLIVVDLGGRDATQVEPTRIQEQLREFQPQALRYFFGPKTVASCKSVVLFINKSDLIAGTPAQVEKEAMDLYQTLINDLMKYSTQIDVRVFVGSASYGHSTHLLFSHFVEKILPRNAYDNQLLQRMKSDFANTRVPAMMAAVPQFQPPPLPPASTPGSVPGNGAAQLRAPAQFATAQFSAAQPQHPAPLPANGGLQPPQFTGAPAGLGDTAPLMSRTTPYTPPRKG